MKNTFTKLKTWVYRDDIDLSKKWWHRFLKVLFVISIISLAFYIAVLLSDSYNNLVNRWIYVESFSSRLSKEPLVGKVVSVNQLFNDNEVVTSFKMYSDDYHPSLKSKKYLFPMSAMFLEDYKSENFCSSELYKHIENIATMNKIMLFSPIDPTFNKLSPDLEAFTTYLKNNSWTVNCVMANSYSIENEQGKIIKYRFLEPINTYDYNIYKYENGFVNFIFMVLFSIVGVAVYVLASMVIYYKVILYIVFGSKK